MTRTARIAVRAAVLLSASPPAIAQGIRAENTPPKQGPSATVGVRESHDSPDKEIQRMIRGAEYHLDRAEKQLADGQHPSACRSLASARNLSITPELGSRWARLCGQLQKIGAERFAAAEALYQRGRYLQAVDEYRRIAATFAPLPVAKAARRAMVEARDDPEVQAAIDEVRAARRFKYVAALLQPTTAPTTRPAAAPRRRPVTAEAIMALTDGPFRRAVDTLESIVRSFGGAPTAGQVRAILRAIRADAKATARLVRLRRAQRAAQALAKAEAYEKAGLASKAAGLYRQLIKDFPDTPQAARAGGLLAGLTAASSSE